MELVAIAISGIVCPLAIFLISRKIDRNEKARQKKDDERAKARQEENVLIIKSLWSLGHLAEATAIAVVEKKVNGEMSTAMKYHTQNKDDLNDYLLKQNAKANHG